MTLRAVTPIRTVQAPSDSPRVKMLDVRKRQGADGFFLEYYRQQYVPSLDSGGDVATAVFDRVRIDESRLEEEKKELLAAFRLFALDWQTAPTKKERARASQRHLPGLRARGDELRRSVMGPLASQYFESALQSCPDVFLVVSDEMAVPWELLHFGAGKSARFLSEGSFVARYPILPVECPSAGADRDPKLLLGEERELAAVLVGPRFAKVRSALGRTEWAGQCQLLEPGTFEAIRDAVESRLLIGVVADLASKPGPVQEACGLDFGELLLDKTMGGLVGFTPGGLIVILACGAAEEKPELPGRREALCSGLASSIPCSVTGPLGVLPVNAAVPILSPLFRGLLLERLPFFRAWRRIDVEEAGFFPFLFSFYGLWNVTLGR